MASTLKIKIISHTDEPFDDRFQAGRLLGEQLKYLEKEEVVVLGIPRGGLVVANEIARILKARLDIVLSRKLGAPGNSELAIGAITEEGKTFLNQGLAHQVGADREYVDEEKRRQLAEIMRRSILFRRIHPKVTVKNRCVIIADDGVATGATMQAAIWAAREDHPLKIVAALPVGPVDTLKRLAQDVDELVCLRAPDNFAALSQFYLDFDQVSDDEVQRILEEK